MAEQELSSQSDLDFCNISDWVPPEPFAATPPASLENVDPDLQWLNTADMTTAQHEQSIEPDIGITSNMPWQTPEIRRSVSEPPGMAHDDGKTSKQRLIPPLLSQQVVFQRDGISLGTPFQYDPERKQERLANLKRPRSQALNRAFIKRNKKEPEKDDYIQQSIDKRVVHAHARLQHAVTSEPRSTTVLQKPVQQLSSPFQTPQPRSVLQIGIEELQSIVAVAVREAIMAVCKH